MQIVEAAGPRGASRVRGFGEGCHLLLKATAFAAGIIAIVIVSAVWSKDDTHCQAALAVLARFLDRSR